jgi:hypothetical protein
VLRAEKSTLARPAGQSTTIASDRLILGYLRRLARAFGPARVFPSVPTIASRTGLSDRTVQRRIAALQAAGLLELVPDPSTRTGRRFLLVEGECHPKPPARPTVTPARCQPVTQSAPSAPKEFPSSSAPPPTPPRSTTTTVPPQGQEPDPAGVACWFASRRRGLRNAAAYRFTLAGRWRVEGIPADIATAYAAWKAQEAAQEARRAISGPPVDRKPAPPEPWPTDDAIALLRATIAPHRRLRPVEAIRALKSSPVGSC